MSINWFQALPVANYPGGAGVTFKSMASDTTGQYIVGVTATNIWKSDDYGATWTNITPTGIIGANWTNIVSDTTGTVLAAYNSGGDPGKGIYATFGTAPPLASASWTLITGTESPIDRGEMFSLGQFFI
jgi:hypothetical protein